MSVQAKSVAKSRQIYFSRVTFALALILYLLLSFLLVGLSDQGEIYGYWIVQRVLEPTPLVVWLILLAYLIHWVSVTCFDE